MTRCAPADASGDRVIGRGSSFSLSPSDPNTPSPTVGRILIAMETGVKPVTQAVDSLAGMTALVTGAGSGIGQATARALSAAGARVVVTELPDRLERAEATVSELKHGGGDALAVELEVRNVDSISDCVDA